MFIDEFVIFRKARVDLEHTRGLDQQNAFTGPVAVHVYLDPICEEQGLTHTERQAAWIDASIDVVLAADARCGQPLKHAKENCFLECLPAEGGGIRISLVLSWGGGGVMYQGGTVHPTMAAGTHPTGMLSCFQCTCGGHTFQYCFQLFLCKEFCWS